MARAALRDASDDACVAATEEENDEAFLEWLRQVHEFNRGNGMTAMEGDEVLETPLSAAYSIASVRWAATFRKTGDEPMRFRISYVLGRSPLTSHARIRKTR